MSMDEKDLCKALRLPMHPSSNARLPRTRMETRTSWPVSAVAAANTWSTGTATATPTAASVARKSTGAGKIEAIKEDNENEKV